MNSRNQQSGVSLAIRQEIQRFESVHPSIYAIYDLIESIPDPILAQQVREHVVCIEGKYRTLYLFIHCRRGEVFNCINWYRARQGYWFLIEMGTRKCNALPSLLIVCGYEIVCRGYQIGETLSYVVGKSLCGTVGQFNT